MRPSPTGMLLASVALAGTWGFSSYGQGGSQETATVVKTARGGLLATTPQHQFEVFFYPTGVRVFPRTTAGQPVDTSRAAGTATFYHPNSPRPWFSRPLGGTPGQAGSLDLAIGLGERPGSGGEGDVRGHRPRRRQRVSGHLHRPPRIRPAADLRSRRPPGAASRPCPATSTPPATMATATIPTAAPPRPLPRRVPTTAIAARAVTSAATGTPSGPATAIGPPGGTCRSPSRG